MTDASCSGAQLPARLWVRLGVAEDETEGSFATLVARRRHPTRPSRVTLHREDPGDAVSVDVNAVIPGWGAPLVFVAVLWRRPDVDHEFFSRYWSRRHAPFGRLIAGARGYLQLHATRSDAPFDGVCVVPFDDLTTLDSAFASPLIRVEARADEARFIDHSRSYSLVCDLADAHAPFRPPGGHDPASSARAAPA